MGGKVGKRVDDEGDERVIRGRDKMRVSEAAKERVKRRESILPTKESELMKLRDKFIGI